MIGEKTVLPGPWSKETLLKNPGERLAYENGYPPKDSLILVLRHQQFATTDSAFVAGRDSIVQMLQAFKGAAEPGGSTRSATRVFSRVQTAGNTMLDESAFVSEDAHALLVKADTHDSVDLAAGNLRRLPELLQRWQQEHPGFLVSYISSGTADGEVFSLIARDLDRSLIYTLPLTLLVLIWAFGSVVAALVPLFMAVVSLFSSLGVSAFFSHVVGPISGTASQLVVLLVLAVGIDYSLFIISRVREEVSNGKSYEAAIAAARVSTGLAVLWSGLTVGVSLVGLLLMQDSVLTSMAVVSILAVAITVAGSVGVLPSLLLLLGGRIEQGRIKLGWVSSSASDPKSGNELLARWLSLSVNHPVKVLLLGGASLLILTSFAGELRLGSTIDPEIMPASMQSTAAFSVLKQNFPKLAGGDFSVVLSAPNLDELEEQGALQPFFEAILENEAVHGPIAIDRSADLTGARFNYVAAGSWNNPVTQLFIDRLRAQVIPQLLSPLGVQAHLSGTLPYVVDDTERYVARTSMVFGIVLVLSVLFLLVAFRSLVVPVKAVLLNILSTTASFGVLVLVFQHSNLPGWQHGVIEGFVPALLFSILFGLSMDYHVFLLSRVREEVERGVDTEQAVKRGILATAGAITSAALIMVSVFLVIAMLELPIMRQLGVGLAVAVFLDATIVRSLLLPASMVLLGKWNWYLPKSLNWLPRVKID